MKRIIGYLNIWMLLVSMSTLTACSFEDNAVEPVKPVEPESGFFTTAINKMIDENYELVKANGHAELVIPSTMFDHTAFKIPDNEKGDMDYVAKAGYKTLVVGGTVRDAVLGQASNDVDFTSDATPEQLAEIVPNTKIFVTPSGYKVAQAWHGDVCTDMGTFRAIYWYLRGQPGIPESSYPVTDKSPNVYSKEVWEDSYDRDLTINAVYYDYQTGNLLDYHGGLHDLREGIIRSTANPDVMFPNNPTNMIRSIRFAARFGFTIDPETDKAIRKHLSACDALGAEGIAYDLIKVFHDGNMTQGYQLIKDYGLLERYFLTLKDTLKTSGYDNYAKAAYAYLDGQKNKDYAVSLATLFLPIVEKAMQGKTTDLQTIKDTYNALEKDSKQADYFLIGDKIKADMFQIWLLVSQMGDKTVIDDATKKAAVKADGLFAKALLVLQAKAQTDAEAAKIVDLWK